MDCGQLARVQSQLVQVRKFRVMGEILAAIFLHAAGPETKTLQRPPRTRRGQRHIEEDEELRNAVFSQTARLLSGFSPLNDAASQLKTPVTSRLVAVYSIYEI